MASPDDSPTEGMSQGSQSDNNNKKRKHEDEDMDYSKTPPLPSLPDLPDFPLNSKRADHQGNKDDSAEWQTVPPKKKAKKIPKEHSKSYPTIEFSSKSSRLSAPIKISDLQTLVLYILADSGAPQFVAVRNRPNFRKVVVLMVPGLEWSMFQGNSIEADSERKRGDSRGEESGRERNYISPDDYYPMKLRTEKLHNSLHPLADIFDHIWPVKTPGDDRQSKMHSPLHAMLSAPAPKTKEEKDWKKNRKGVVPVREPQGWRNNRVSINEYILSVEDLLENDYTLHPAVYDDEVEKQQLKAYRQSSGLSQEHGWVDTLVKSLEDGAPLESEIESGSITAGRDVFAMDCEMCKAANDEFVLTRISIVSWDGTVVLDELVKPDVPIVDYVTQYSGITEAMLAPVTTTLSDIQKKLLEILHPKSILIGHSLNSDLTALKITHPFVVDTAVLFPHPRGPPLKSSLKWLAKKYLNREIQKGHGSTGPGAGHDSIEDAKTCLDLVKQKCEKGKEWGTGEIQGENIFKRVARAGVKYKNQGGSAIPSPMDGKSSAAVDWGDPRRGPGGAASFPIGCKSDEDVMNGVIRAVKGDHDGKEIPGKGVDFVWARFRELEALKGWWNNNRTMSAAAASKVDVPIVDAAPETASSTQQDTDGKPVALAVEKLELDFGALPPPKDIDTSKSVSEATAELVNRITKIHESLPPCTALIIYSGSGDPREMSRLQALNTQFKREYKTKKWDELSVKWTDVEEQALRRASQAARNGVGFIGVK